MKLRVLVDEEVKELNVYEGKSIRQILIENNIMIDSPCGGNGTCGKCKVQILNSNVETSKSDSLRLSADEIKDGFRLSCQCYPKEDCVIRLNGAGNGYKIQTGYEGEKHNNDSRVKPININVKSEDLQCGGSITDIINSKAGINLGYSYRALKKLSLVLSKCSEYNFHNSLYGIENIALIVEDHSNVLDIQKTDETNIYGIAIDIGTTTVVLSLVDMLNGTVIKTHSALNSQRKFGADVISRIQYSKKGNMDEIRNCVRNDILSGIRELCENTIKTENIYEIAVAGNTTMFHLLLGLYCESLALYPFNSVTTSIARPRFSEVFESDLLECGVTLLPGASSYVGADIISGMLQCNFDRLEETGLLIDIGTNGEMVIGNKKGCLCLATAAGPAFEGANITCGTGSVTGAISTVRVYGSRVSYETIGGASPVGICGSGVLDIVSQALRNGIIDKTGRINEDYEEDYIEVARTERGEAVIFTQKDIREVQLAKSAIRSGIEILLKNFGCKIEDVDTVYLAGGFGNNLNIESAVSIGLIPSQLSDKIKPVGNSALGGAVKYLLDKNSGESLKTITGMTKYMDISADPEFNDLFIRNMLF